MSSSIKKTTLSCQCKKKEVKNMLLLFADVDHVLIVQINFSDTAALQRTDFSGMYSVASSSFGCIACF